MAHLRYVHGYDNVGDVQPVSVDGPLFKTGFDFRSSRKVTGIASLNFDLSARASIYGLGYSFVEIHEHPIGGNDNPFWPHRDDRFGPTPPWS